MHSFLTCFPLEYQITDHEGAILDVLIVVPSHGFKVLSSLKAAGQPFLFCAINFKFSSVVGGRLVEMLDSWRSESYIGGEHYLSPINHEIGGYTRVPTRLCSEAPDHCR